MAGLAFLATAASIVGTGLTFVGGLQQASEQERAAEFAAQQKEIEAQQQRAIAGAKAREHYRQSRLVQSRQLAVAAKSGGAADPSVVGAIADVAGEGEFRALTEQAVGETAARAGEAQADELRRLGQARADASRFKAFSSLLTGAAGTLDVYSQFADRFSQTQSKPGYSPPPLTPA